MNQGHGTHDGSSGEDIRHEPTRKKARVAGRRGRGGRGSRRGGRGRSVKGREGSNCSTREEWSMPSGDRNGTEGKNSCTGDERSGGVNVDVDDFTIAPVQPTEGRLPQSSSVQNRIDELCKQNNDLKEGIRQKDELLMQKETVIKALSLQLRRKNEQCAILEAQNNSLKVAKREMMNIPLNNTKRLAAATCKMPSAVAPEYLGIILQLEKKLVHWVHKEIAELDPNSSTPKRL